MTWTMRIRAVLVSAALLVVFAGLPLGPADARGGSNAGGLPALTETVATLQRLAASLEEEVDALRTTSVAQQAQIQELQLQVSDLEEACAAQNDALAQLTLRVELNESDIAALQLEEPPLPDIAGEVDQWGQIVSGGGFTLSELAVGADYKDLRIDFDEAFVDVPEVEGWTTGPSPIGLWVLDVDEVGFSARVAWSPVGDFIQSFAFTVTGER